MFLHRYRQYTLVDPPFALYCAENNKKLKMRTAMNASLCIALVFVAGTWASAESSVWKATRDGSTIYLGGTCHVLRPTDYPLPAEFDEAYGASETIVFETDMGALKDPSTQQAILAKATYDDGSTVEEHLSAEAYALLSSYCASNNVPLDALKQFKPSMIVITIMTMELMKLGVMMEGVDTFYDQKAIADGKTREFLETVEQQIDFVFGMPESNDNKFVTHSISEIGLLPEVYESLVGAWRTGDMGKLGELMISELKEEIPQLYEELLTDRNEAWMPRISAFHKTPQVEFILVGAGHLVGPDGIIATLEKQGFQVERVIASKKSPEKVGAPAMAE